MKCLLNKQKAHFFINRLVSLARVFIIFDFKFEIIIIKYLVI